MRYNKFLAYIMIFVMMLGIVGCGDNKSDKNTTEAEAVSTEAEQAYDSTQTQTTEPTTEEQIQKDVTGFYPVEDYVETVGDTINVRYEPSTDANIYVLLGPGEVVKRTGYNEEWSRVVIDGDTVYIYSEYVIETEAPSEEEIEDEPEATPGDAKEDIKKIVIDPGKQSNANMVMEEIGPGSTETKMGASDGFTGSILGTKESDLNLEYALLLKSELESRGYEVVLTRESDSVDITNKARAEFANSEEADIFIRIQMNYSSNSELAGVMAITMTKQSPYNSDLYSSSTVLATRILQNVILQTGATNHGIYETDQMTVINWSEAPVAVINLGYLSNETDEANLTNAIYKTKIITGMADGVDDYFQK